MSKPRILLADDHMLLLDGLRLLLERHYDLVGIVRDGWSVLREVQRLQPDLILMDVAMPLINGLESGERLREHHPKVKLLYVASYGDRPYVDKAIQIGASGYVLKRSGWDELSRGIEAVLAGKQYVSTELAVWSAQPPLLPHVLSDSSVTSLTDRQRQILKLVAAGYTAKEIGRMLNITSKAVHFHKARLARRLQLRSIRELPRYAFTHGLSNI
jgi:DNA-binding NarL/FixJ family response regulator